jgi:hypothetical protein
MKLVSFFLPMMASGPARWIEDGKVWWSTWAPPVMADTLAVIAAGITA